MRLPQIVSTIAFVALAACSNAREYELRGQILAVNASRLEITIKHEDIRGFMPGMTMPFKVREAALLDGRVPGDLVKATLVVEETDAYLASLERTGHAPLSEAPPAAPPTAILEPGETVADVELTDQAGRARRLSDWRGQVLAVTFVYTRCPVPNFCPLMDRQFASAQRAIETDAGLRGRVHLVSMSFDPTYDTPAILAEHARGAGANPEHWTFATGAREAVDAFASQFGVSIIRGDDEAQEIVHNLRTAVIGPDGKLVTIFPGAEWTPEQLLDAVRRAGE